ncbi:MAG TPA: FUSC family protein [Candidatus Lustribacter sp.]
MPSTGADIARKIVADALRPNWSGVEIRFAVRCTVGVALPLIVSALLGQPLAGASAAYGALVTGLASRQGVYRTRVGVMLLSGATIAISGLAGAVTGPFPPANGVLLAVWALVFGVVASLGRAATVVAVNACVAFVLFSNPPYDTANPGFHALMVFAGAALQMILLVLVWPLDRFGAERAAVARAFTGLSQYASSLRADDLGLPDAESVAAVSTTLADPQPFGSRAEIAAYQALADEAERLRGTLAALATEQHLLYEVGAVAAAGGVLAVGHVAAPLLDAVAAAVAAGRAPESQLDDVRRLDDAVRELERQYSEDAPYVGDARALAGQLRAALRSAGVAASGGLAIDNAPVRAAYFDARKVQTMAGRLLANCSWRSIYARHAIRLAVTLTIALIAQHLLPLAHAQWIGLTVVLVLRPDFASTFTRGVGRVAGTVGGAILAAVVAAFHPSDPAYIVLTIAFAGIGFALFNVSYALFSAAITGYVVYLLAFGGASEQTSAPDRVAATALGGLLALGAYTLWPAWTRARVADDLADLIDALRRYLALVLSALAEPSFDDAVIREAQVAAWRARSNAEASVDRMAGEPVRPRRISLRGAAGILAATQRLGIGTFTLRTRVGRGAGARNEHVERLARDLDIALLAIVEALRGSQPPNPLPPLRDDQIALKRVLDDRRDPAVEVLVSETDLIVDSVNTLAAILARGAPRPHG